jgi:ketosteroid isomerase-like protein
MASLYTSFLGGIALQGKPPHEWLSWAAIGTFPGPVASFDSAEGYRAMARQAGAAITSFRVRHQFTDGNLVCSVVDWTMASVPGTLSAAEVLEIRDGRIVRGELFYDAEELRKAMAQGTTG